LGYKVRNKKNKLALCTIPGQMRVDGIGADREANVIVPNAIPYGSGTINVFAPGRGSELGSISVSSGEPVDAASANAATGRIVVGNLNSTTSYGGYSHGIVYVCTLKAACTAPLANTNITGEVGAVTMDTKGDCWAVSENESFSSPAMTYWKGCNGAGEAVTGFMNQSYGGLDIDRSGNILSIDFEYNNLYVYSGCNPVCKLVVGPFPLHGGGAFYGKLRGDGKVFAAVEPGAAQVDVYGYASKALTYRYSFNAGLSMSLTPEGIAYAPDSKQ
jgi:hypothetical protein